jgi:hypothetical protein
MTSLQSLSLGEPSDLQELLALLFLSVLHDTDLQKLF